MKVFPFALVMGKVKETHWQKGNGVQFIIAKFQTAQEDRRAGGRAYDGKRFLHNEAVPLCNICFRNHSWREISLKALFLVDIPPLN